MPLATRDGRPAAATINQTLPNSPVIIDAPSIFDHQPFIEDSFVNRTAFNPTTYAQEFGLLQRYTQGSRITVTYFLLSTPTSGLQRSEAIDPSILRNPVSSSYTQINNFEIVAQDGGWKNAFDAERVETKVTGEALLYPGMQPRKGDIFITPIGDSKFGIFQVTDVQRLTWRQGTNHKISFFLREYGSDASVDIFKQSVTKTVWFDKTTYLGDATTLLTSDGYVYLQTLRKLRTLLIRYYYNTFYSPQMSSIIAPSGFYDPYLVKYLNSQISIRDSTYRATQLYPGLQNYENSLWSLLLDRTNRQLVGIQSAYDLFIYRVTRLDISITSLANHPLLVLKNANRTALTVAENTPSVIDQITYLMQTLPSITIGSGIDVMFNQYQNFRRNWGTQFTDFNAATFYDIPEKSLYYLSTTQGYIFSENFYNGTKSLMTPFEFLVYAVIQERRIHDIYNLIDGCLNRYTMLSYDEQFYFIPVYLWLIDIAIRQISAPSNFMT